MSIPHSMKCSLEERSLVVSIKILFEIVFKGWGGDVGAPARSLYTRRESDTKKMADLEVASLVNRAYKLPLRKRYSPNEVTRAQHLTRALQRLGE